MTKQLLDPSPRAPTRRSPSSIGYELRDNVTAYDATYVALAEVLDCDFVTGDQRLAGGTHRRVAVDAESEAK